MVLAAHPTVELSKYDLLEEIGHGGMATVFRARDPRLGREVAIKVIHRHLRESPEVAARFRSEALAVAKVKHPNIVEVYDVSDENEIDKYLVVELIRGLTLRQLLLEQGPLPPEVAACIAVEISRALSCAHREGVVHRDIKPENVLLSMTDLGSTSGGDTVRVKLTDFGIAKLLDAQGVTHTGQVLGSPAHMAPEQIEGGDVDARADVFGTGVLLYEMLTGALPFEGKNPAQVLRKVLEGIFLPAERQLPRVGSTYGKIANHALARDPADRFPSATALGDALEEELSSLGVKDVRSEISRYLDDPEKYMAEHERVIPDAISKCASEARGRGEVVRAAALFNRALAYRPDDTQLLAEVAGLARRGRFRRRVASALVVVLGTLSVAGGLYWWVQERAERQVAHEASKQRKLEAAKKLRSEKEAAERENAPELTPPVPPPAQPAAAPVEPRKKRTVPKLRQPVQSVPKGKRLVRTPIIGPQNASVRIDGRLLSWFQMHNLALGPHTFEFVPPNTECCETSPPRTVTIVAGEGAQFVRGVIKFRPATLRLSAPEGSKATCGIGQVLFAGASVKIPMDRPERRLHCEIHVPNGQGEPKSIDVALRPGATFILKSP